MLGSCKSFCAISTATGRRTHRFNFTLSNVGSIYPHSGSILSLYLKHKFTFLRILSRISGVLSHSKGTSLKENDPTTLLGEATPLAGELVKDAAPLCPGWHELAALVQLAFVLAMLAFASCCQSQSLLRRRCGWLSGLTACNVSLYVKCFTACYKCHWSNAWLNAMCYLIIIHHHILIYKYLQYINECMFSLLHFMPIMCMSQIKTSEHHAWTSFHILYIYTFMPDHGRSIPYIPNPIYQTRQWCLAWRSPGQRMTVPLRVATAPKCSD